MGKHRGQRRRVGRRIGLLLLALMLVASLTFGVARAGDTNVRRGAATGPLLGITGNVARFQSQTGQASSVHHAFLGWGQGLSYGSTFASLFPTLGPIPMIHLGTEGQSAPEAITPGGIAAGQGDGYLVALNKAIATWNKGIYVRPLAEMNNSANAWSGYRANGQPKDAAHSPATYRKAFARIYVILHGGSASAVNAKLRQLGLPPVKGELFANPFPRLRIVWSPLAADVPRVAGNAAQLYYPGPGYVDVDGGSIYDERLTDTAPWQGLENLYRLSRSHKKPFSVPEWGLSQVDDPAFVQHMCTFLKTHDATEVAAFYESRPGSRYDLEPKPKSRAAYRECITPLAGPLPAWAGVEPKVIALKLTSSPGSGPAPLDVQFSVAARLSVPIVHWELTFGDGSESRRRGPAARNRPAPVCAGRHVRGDVDRLFVTPVHSRVRALPHLSRGDRRNGHLATCRLHADAGSRHGPARGLLPDRSRLRCRSNKLADRVGRRQHPAGERPSAAFHGTHVHERGQIPGAPGRERTRRQAIPGAGRHRRRPTRRGERDADGDGAVEREAVHGRAGSVWPDGSMSRTARFG